MEKLTSVGFLHLAAFALALVLFTYNPSGYSYVHMLQAGFPAVTPLEAVLGIVLLIGIPAVGMSWSHLYRRWSGQATVEDGVDH